MANNDSIVVRSVARRFEFFIVTICVSLRYRPEEYKVLSTFPRRDVRILMHPICRISATLNSLKFEKHLSFVASLS